VALGGDPCTGWPVQVRRKPSQTIEVVGAEESYDIDKEPRLLSADWSWGIYIEARP
jgi:hypothetical protein